MPDAAATAGRAPVGTARRAIAALSASFREAGLPSAELDARLLVFDACRLSAEAYMLRPETPLDMADAKLIAAFEARRIAREPVSRILGYREFWGRRFAIGPAVLDPRPDTETLIEAALALLPEMRDAAPRRILDLGTGSGCILLTLLAEIPQAWGVGADISAQALKVARDNAQRLDLASRAAFVQCDWGETFTGSFDVIVANPPYINSVAIGALDEEVRCHDPNLALDGGTDGFAAYRRIVDNCTQIASPATWVILEVGIGQASRVTELFRQAGWAVDAQRHRVFQDLSRIDRVVAIKRQAPHG